MILNFEKCLNYINFQHFRSQDRQNEFWIPETYTSRTLYSFVGRIQPLIVPKNEIECLKKIIKIHSFLTIGFLTITQHGDKTTNNQAKTILIQRFRVRKSRYA